MVKLRPRVIQLFNNWHFNVMVVTTLQPEPRDSASSSHASVKRRLPQELTFLWKSLSIQYARRIITKKVAYGDIRCDFITANPGGCVPSRKAMPLDLALSSADLEIPRSSPFAKGT